MPDVAVSLNHSVKTLSQLEPKWLVYKNVLEQMTQLLVFWHSTGFLQRHGIQGQLQGLAARPRPRPRTQQETNQEMR